MRVTGLDPTSLCAPLMLGLALLVAAPATAAAPERDLLSAALAEFSPGSRAKLDKGDPIARVIDTPDNLEVIVIGLVRLSSSRERALAAFRDPQGLRPAETLRQFGRVSQPPQAGDFASFVVDPVDAKDLLHCRLGKCEVRLPEEEAARLPTPAVSKLDAGPSAEFMKRLLLARAESYDTRGNAGLPVYYDRPRSVHVHEVLITLLRTPPWANGLLSEVTAHMDGFPAARGADVEDAFYWLVEKRYRAPVVSLTHAALFPQACGGACVAFATKQVYASHYFEASMDVLVFIPDEGRSYLLYLNRSRADNPRPRFYWFERALLELMVKKMIRADLTRLAARLKVVEQPAPQSGGSSKRRPR
jgi:hypothetical protein